VHSEYALAVNRIGERSGHLWQNRFFSCPLDEAHLITALRYVDLNPVRANLVAQASDWPWSSAGGHTMERAGDAVLDWRWREWLRFWDCGEWRDLLLAATPDSEPDLIRQATRTGAPLGSQEFIRLLESRAGRRLRVRPRGRPRKNGV
jgi:putative transposase